MVLGIVKIVCVTKLTAPLFWASWILKYWKFSFSCSNDLKLLNDIYLYTRRWHFTSWNWNDYFNLKKSNWKSFQYNRLVQDELRCVGFKVQATKTIVALLKKVNDDATINFRRSKFCNVLFFISENCPKLTVKVRTRLRRDQISPSY